MFNRSQGEALRRMLSLLAAEPAIETFLGHVLRATSEQLNAYSSALYLYNSQKDAVLCRMTYKGGRVLVRGKEAIQTVEFRDPIRKDDLLWQTLSEDPRPLIIEDVPNSPLLRDEFRPQALTCGIRTILLLPLLLGDNLIGAFSVRSQEDRKYQPEEKELAQGLAHQVTLAVQVTRLAEQGQQSILLQERNRMAQEIHDTLAQGFTGIVVQLEAAEDALGEENEEARKHIIQARRLARESLGDVRRSVWALRPGRLERGDLHIALASLVDQLTHGTTIHADFVLEGTPRLLLPVVETNLLRIGQEALSNALRHARAKKIEVKLTFEAQQVRLSVEDDGLGFDPQLQVTAEGLGLTNMQDRVRRMDGDLTIHSRPSNGTRIEAVVPLSGRASQG